MSIAHDRRTRFAPGFSLIELLVSLAIIATLIGILLPTLSSARDAAKRVGCSSNLRQIGLAIELYTEDHQGTFPAASYMPSPWLSKLRADADNPGGVPSFNDAMRAFLESDEIYKCPGDRVVFDTPIDPADPFGAVGGSSYTYVTILAGRTINEVMGSRFGQMLGFTPSSTPVMHDFDNAPVVDDGSGGYETEDGRLISVGYFHNSRNLLYADGHVDKASGIESIDDGGER